MRVVRWVVLLVLAATCGFNAMAAPPTVGTVVAIQDGDTLDVFDGSRAIRIRVAQIDAPEKAQPFGQRARQSLADLCFKRHAQVTPKEHDRYGRVVADLTCDGVDVGTHQVRTGMAWVFRRYAHDPSLLALEEQARASRTGLWGDAQPVPPWEWRRARRENE